jgi:hypothetical protein
MPEEMERLEAELKKLQVAHDSLAGMPETQAPLLRQIEEKQRALAKLRSEQPSSAGGTSTTIHGTVNGPLLSGAFSGPVTVGPTVIGSVSSGRDTHIATNQTIRNVDTRGGDYAEGNISKDQITVAGISNSHGVAIGRGASASVHISDALGTTIQALDRAQQLGRTERAELQQLIRELQAALRQAPEAYREAAEAIVEEMMRAVDAATASTPNKTRARISTEGLKQAAVNLAVVLPGVVDLAGSIADKVRLIVGS